VTAAAAAANRRGVTAPRPSILVPFGVACLGIALFSVMDAVMKHLVLAIGTYNAVLWRTGTGAVIAGILFFALRSPWPAAHAMRIHLTRGLVGAVMAMLFFWGLGRVPLAQAIALAFIAPLISLYLAALILKERIERQAVFASMLGLAGVIVIFSGQAEADLGREAVYGSLAVLASACLYAYNIILMRQQALVARPLEVAFFIPAISSSAFLLGAPFLLEMPQAEHWPSILSGALLAFGSLLLLAWAYARAQAQHLAPVEYTSFVWAAVLGWLVFDEKVSWFTLAGAALIVGACLIAATRREPDHVLQAETGIPGAG
jgi:S-adenosylmethionine uptake transporter